MDIVNAYLEQKTEEMRPLNRPDFDFSLSADQEVYDIDEEGINRVLLELARAYAYEGMHGCEDAFKEELSHYIKAPFSIDITFSPLLCEFRFLLSVLDGRGSSRMFGAAVQVQGGGI